MPPGPQLPLSAPLSKRAPVSASADAACPEPEPDQRRSRATSLARAFAHPHARPPAARDRCPSSSSQETPWKP